MDLVLENAILQTIEYFYIFEYPLTQWELLKCTRFDHAVGGIKLIDIIRVLDSSELLRQKLDTKSGFFFLKGKFEHVKTRQRRYVVAERKYRRALFAARLLSLLPWVQVVAVCNSLGFSNASEDSDIDLFVITDDRAIWTTRFFSASMMKLLRLRPTSTVTRDRICLSFYVAKSRMNLETIALENDIYLQYWIFSLVPIFDRNDVFAEFIYANQWLKRIFMHRWPVIPVNRRRIEATWIHLPRSISKAERLFKKIQLRILPASLKKLNNAGDGVVLSDMMLKLHSTERRAYYRDMDFEKMKAAQSIERRTR